MSSLRSLAQTSPVVRVVFRFAFQAVILEVSRPVPRKIGTRSEELVVALVLRVQIGRRPRCGGEERWLQQ